MGTSAETTVTLGDATVDAPERSPHSAAGKSPLKIALGRLRRDTMAVVCFAIVVFFILVAIFAPVLTAIEGQDYSSFHTDLVDLYLLPVIGPNSAHWFGVEPQTGRDLFAQWAHGARPSLAIAFIASIMTTIIGVTAGLVSGFLGGWIDRIISWVIDFILSLNYLLLAIAVSPIVISMKGGILAVSPTQVADIRLYSLIGVLVFFGWASLARLIRGEVLSLREREFVQAAKVLGVPTRRTLFRELLPNLVAPIVIQFSLAVPAYIVAEAGLSFLGVGLIDPIPSWGQLISRAQNYYSVDPLYLWIPVLSVSVLTLALSWLGDSVRDAFDPKTRR